MTTPTAQQFLTAMRSYLGVVESPNGSNRTRVGVEFGWNGVAWCAETISVAAQKAGFGRKFWSASTDQWEARARSGYNGSRWFSRSITPRPGDICVWDWKGDGTANHVSVIETVRADGKFVTIGGNESNRCQRAVRSRSGLRGFVRLPFRVATAAPAPAPTNPFGTWPNNTSKPTLRNGSTGSAVKYLQSVISKKAGGRITVDGIFGDQTERRVRDLQTLFHIGVDGIVGPKTWGAVDYLAKH